MISFRSPLDGFRSPFGAPASSSGSNLDPEFPRARNEYGLILRPSPNLMVTSPVQQATLPTPETFTIPAGSGNAYRALVSSGITFGDVGSKVVFYITVDEGSGSHSTPTVRLIAASPFGTQTLNLVEETPRKWVYEATVPTGGFTSVLLTLASTDASNPITGAAWAWSVSPVGATASAPEADTACIDAWVASGYAEGQGNLWPVEKSAFNITAADSSESLRGGRGISIDATDDMLLMYRVRTLAGDPGFLDRDWLSGVTQFPNGSQNAFVHPAANRPGVHARRFKLNALQKATSYLEIFGDNAQSGAFYSQETVQITDIQLFRNSFPAVITSPSLLSYNASDGIVARNFDGLIDVYTPLFASTGREYMQWQSRTYDTTGNALGGGIGHILEEIIISRRTGTYDFCPVFDLTDSGLSETSMKPNDGGDTHIGHDVHFGSARRAAPLFQVDTGSGWVTEDAAARDEFLCQKVSWTEYQNVFSRADGTTVIATHDTQKVWEGDTLKVYNSITFPDDIEMLVIFPFIPSFWASIDDNAANGATFGTITLPNQGGATYTPGGGVNATYPAEKRFVTTSPSGLAFDIEVKSATPPTFRSWWQSGSTRKLYLALVQADSFGLVADRVPLSIPGGTTYTMETWMKVTK